MSYVVTNEKVFKEFETLEEAVRFYSSSQEYGLNVFEKDVFGNLTPVPIPEINAAKEKIEEEKSKQESFQQQAQQAQQEPNQPQQPTLSIKVEQPQQPRQQAEGESNFVKIAKYVLIAFLAIITLVVFMRVVMPMIKEFVAVYRAV